MIITLLRKPLEGSVADNTLKHGCGAINIDASRVSSHDKTKNHSRKSESSKSKGIYGDSNEQETHQTKGQEIGRWPANFILTHKEECELVGTKKVKSNGHWTQKANIGKFYEGGWSHQEVDEGNKMSDEDGRETVANWTCVEGCPVKTLDRQSGVSKSTGGRIGNSQGAYSHLGETGFKDNAIKGESGFGDTGGASRFFKQFKKGNDQ